SELLCDRPGSVVPQGRLTDQGRAVSVTVVEWGDIEVPQTRADGIERCREAGTAPCRSEAVAEGRAAPLGNADLRRKRTGDEGKGQGIEAVLRCLRLLRQRRDLRLQRLELLRARPCRLVTARGSRHVHRPGYGRDSYQHEKPTHVIAS